MSCNSPISHQEPKPLLSLDHTNAAGHQDAVLGAPANSINTLTTTAQVVDHHQKMMINKKSSAGAVVKYMECLKNHAAAIGGNATDGCGEFMAGGEEGTIEALKCSACSCHRNFHRKIHIHQHHHHHHHHHHHDHQPSSSIIINSSLDHAAPHSVVLKKRKKKSSTTSINYGVTADHHQFLTTSAAALTKAAAEGELVKKRFRTKFSQEQKEKMLGFAEKCEWKLQKVDDSEVRSFCQEIGIKRKVLKVWMHNNKYNFANKTKATISITNSA